MIGSLRERVRQRAEFCCEYCQMPEEFDALVFQWDHIIAQKHGGTPELMNLAWSCFACNNHKQSDIAGIDPENRTFALLVSWPVRTESFSSASPTGPWDCLPSRL